MTEVRLYDLPKKYRQGTKFSFTNPPDDTYAGIWTYTGTDQDKKVYFSDKEKITGETFWTTDKSLRLKPLYAASKSEIMKSVSTRLSSVRDDLRRQGKIDGGTRAKKRLSKHRRRSRSRR
jgi:hypothetical protein